MAGFHVVPTDMLVSSADFTDLQNWAAQIYSGLIGSVDAAAGMAGDDTAGHLFAAKYDPAAQSVVDAFGRAVAQFGGTANGLYTMALNYTKTDADIAANLMRPQALPQSSAPQCDQESQHVAIPSAVGHNTSTVSQVIAKFWPQGSPDKLRQAATNWQHLAGLASTLGTDGDSQVWTVTASSPAKAVDAFAANWAKMHKSGATQGPLLNSISNAASKLGAACESYASSIDNLRHILEGLAIAAGVVAGVGIGLTIFTLGFSDAAAAGGEAAIAAEASAAALAMTTEIEGSSELAVLAEAEEVVNTAAAGLSPVNAAALTTVAAGSVALAGASSAMAAPAPPPSFPVTPGPLPRDPLSAFPALSPAQQRAVRTWMAQMAADGRTTPASGTSGKPLIDARRAYQIRVAGSTEYGLYTTLTKPNGQQYSMDADGVRPEDGAAIDAKYIGQQNSCRSPLKLGNVDNVPDFVYQSTLKGEAFKMDKYASAFQDPRNKVNHLEVITNDPKGAAYFTALMVANKVPGETRIVP